MDTDRPKNTSVELAPRGFDRSSLHIEAAIAVAVVGTVCYLSRGLLRPDVDQAVHAVYRGVWLLPWMALRGAAAAIGGPLTHRDAVSRVSSVVLCVEGAKAAILQTDFGLFLFGLVPPFPCVGPLSFDALLLVGATVVCIRARRASHETERTCPTCGYSLAGIPDKGPCPECGGRSGA